jgi:hypothetical protein
MKLRMRMPLVYGLLWLVSQAVLVGAPAQVSAPRSAADLPAAERLITALPQTNALPIPAIAQSLLDWPSVETLNSQQARQDRSKTIPPLFRQPKIGDAKPIGLGAQVPQAACREAEQWIRRVLKPEWVPDDLASRLHPLQRDPASQSIIVCRYLLEGHAIQINQSRGSMWVIIKPPKTSPLSQNARELASATFNTYFLNSDRMASLQGREISGTAKLRAWLPDFSAPIPPGTLENWWGWRLWLTDGEAVAVFLDKTSEDSARSIMPDDPWF